MNNLESLNIVINAINAAQSRSIYTSQEINLINVAVGTLQNLVNAVAQAQQAQQAAEQPAGTDGDAQPKQDQSPFVSQANVLQLKKNDEPEA